MNNLQHPISNTQHPTIARAHRHWVLDVECWMLGVPKAILVFAIRAYQLVLSPAQTFLFGPTAGCRFTPSCSRYAMDAVQEHGAVRGGVLAAKRICRCHPWSDGGHDPVPNADGGQRTAENKLSPGHSSFGI